MKEFKTWNEVFDWFDNLTVESCGNCSIILNGKILVCSLDKRVFNHPFVTAVQEL